MHTKTSIYWDDADPFPMGSRLEEAFNRVINFCPELRAESDGNPSHRPPEKVSFNRVVGGNFDPDDLRVLADYCRVIHGRITEKHGNSQEAISESVMQACEHLLLIICNTAAYVAKNLSECR